MRTKFWLEKPDWKSPLGRLGVERRAILKWIFRKYGWWVWTGFIWLKIGTADGIL
jgi:uncharacterized membrane protein